MSAVAASPAVSGREAELARALVALAAGAAAGWAELGDALSTAFTGVEADAYLTAAGERRTRAEELRSQYFPRSRAHLAVSAMSADLLTPTGRGSRQMWRTSSCAWAVGMALAWAARTSTAVLEDLPVRRDGGVLVTDVAPLVDAWLSVVDPFPVGTRVRWHDAWTYPECDVAATVICRSQSYAAGDHDWYLRTDDGGDVCAAWEDLAPEGWGSGRSARVSA